MDVIEYNKSDEGLIPGFYHIYANGEDAREFVISKRITSSSSILSESVHTIPKLRS